MGCEDGKADKAQTQSFINILQLREDNIFYNLVNGEYYQPQNGFANPKYSALYRSIVSSNTTLYQEQLTVLSN